MSILNTTKKILGLDPDYTAFDLDIITYINSVFADLQQLGVGPEEGFAIEDSTESWDSYTGDDLNLNSVKTYMSLRVRLLFDPPTSSYLVGSMDAQIQKLEWRLNVHREATEWVEPS